jgi:hypothetical protein
MSISRQETQFLDSYFSYSKSDKFVEGSQICLSQDFLILFNYSEINKIAGMVPNSREVYLYRTS